MVLSPTYPGDILRQEFLVPTKSLHVGWQSQSMWTPACSFHRSRGAAHYHGDGIAVGTVLPAILRAAGWDCIISTTLAAESCVVFDYMGHHP